MLICRLHSTVVCICLSRWEKISSRFYWRGSYDEVKTFIKNCDKCQRKADLKKAKKPLRPIPVPSEAFKQVGMDLIGPLETTSAGNKFIMVITDYFTKWVEAEPIPDKSAEQVLRVFTKFITTHGCPSVLITDQGREFCNQLNDQLCKQFGIEHRIASSYHPQTGGHTERFNRTLCNMLVHFVNSAQNDWDMKLPLVLFAYRTSKHLSTKQTPFYLVFGRQARLPVELNVPQSEGDNDDYDMLLQQRCESFVELSCNREGASMNIKTSQSKQKKYYDAAVHSEDEVFKVGDQVLVHNTRKVTRKGGKLDVKWKGPYHITKASGKGTYFLQGLKTSVSGSRLAIYKIEEDDSSEKDTKEHCQKDFVAEPKEEKKEHVKKGRECKAENIESNDVRHLPLKKRKILDQEGTASASASKPEPFMFKPVNKDWQEQVASVFKSKLKNSYVIGPDRFVRRDARPTRTVNMRGDGNCLFRTFSYLVFGVQTCHSLIRQATVSYMKENENVMKGVLPDPVDRYLDNSMMANSDTWGTEVEIFAFATLTRTTIYVYSKYGGDIWRWLEYKPLTNDDTNDRAMFIQNTSDHFVPVLDVDGEEFSRRPYVRIRNYIPEKYHPLITEEILDGALVNSHEDETLLRKRDKSVTSVYVKPFTNVKYDVDGLRGLSEEVDANIYNLVCDWGDVENKLN
ncbi:uncharacterized protein LOC128550298 [Mercenaria mercenaria]|uniref:uncharacterized protein LOC128550298 n=1 Tax=Mercenaria mercenaria TaxID=6596 RepID=UPI00234E4DEE|nr:uncharacterized protein LOC128550298 [Mercenaria mercenaria]